MVQLEGYIPEHRAAIQMQCPMARQPFDASVVLGLLPLQEQDLVVHRQPYFLRMALQLASLAQMLNLSGLEDQGHEQATWRQWRFRHQVICGLEAACQLHIHC